MLERAYGSERAQMILEKLIRAMQMLPFDSIKRVHPAQLSTFLQDEHPQTIALVIAYLDPQSAAAVMGSLPPELRPEVAERLATMGSTPPEVIRRVENVLQRKLSSIASQELTAAGGVKSLVEVIQWVDRNTERMIFDYLTDNNPELAEEVRKLMFTFEDLLQLDDRSIQQILKEVDMKELALALKGASDALKDKIFRNMSERAVNMLKEELEFMGPVRVRDVEEAQQRIVSIVRRMEEAGEIVISRGGEEEMLI
jgi:flagellar motor switch protein FliG